MEFEQGLSIRSKKKISSKNVAKTITTFLGDDKDVPEEMKAQLELLKLGLLKETSN
eukprot:TRINITY_DN1165_c0_g1_i1.p3 TRINITY_DN1165_c0_g1~~TRINITY_DN1165_c0_g1_i1.p3  ORF type:complete len:56 (+),score=21.87 TRINITY_DN1165_c0_g1_i1:65-232(+)